MKTIFLLFSLFAISSLAQTPQSNLPNAIETIVGLSKGPTLGLVVIAPAKKYLMRERLFTNLAAQLNQSGFITVQFNWRASTLAVPDQEIVRASQDLNAVVRYFQNRYRIQPQHTAIVTKSFSTKALGPSLSLARKHVLLTPNCSIQEPFSKMYGPALQQRGISLSFLISNEDPNCDVRQIHDTFRTLTNLPSLYTTHGDHNFVITTPTTGSLNYFFQDQVVKLVTSQLLL